MTLPSPRMSWYEKSSYDAIQNQILKHVNGFMDDVGFHSITTHLEVLDEM